MGFMTLKWSKTAVKLKLFSCLLFKSKSGAEMRKHYSRQQVIRICLCRHGGAATEWTDPSFSVPWAINPRE